MGATMSPNDGKKYGELRVIRGGLSRALSPMEQLERDVRSWAARGKAHGRYATRALADIATDVRRQPLSTTARAISDGLAAGASVEWAEEIAHHLAKFARAEASRHGAHTQDSQPDRVA